MLQQDHIQEPEQAPGHLKEMGRDAMNLVEFPLALLADRAPKGCKTLVFEDQIEDRFQRAVITRRLTVSGSDRFGLPTALDDEVCLGLLQLTKADRFRSRRVSFSRYQLLRILGWREEGKSYTRLDKSLKRWTGVTLYYDNAWRDNRDKRWVNASFHLLEEVVLRGRSRRKGSAGPLPAGEPASHFTWNEIVFESFRAGYLKRLDLDFYRQLKLAVAKRIYRFLDKRFHFTSELRLDLACFAHEHIGLSRHYDLAQVKRRLSPGIHELEQLGFLRPLPVEERFRRLGRGKWEVLLVRAPQVRKQTKARQALSALEQKLVQRGVAPRIAVRLAQEFPATQIEQKMKVYDTLLAQPSGRMLRNPAGFLVQSIRDNYWSPADVQNGTNGNGDQAGSPDKAPVNSIARTRATRPRRVFYVEQSQFAEYLAGLTASQRHQLEEEALANARGLTADGYRRALESGNHERAQHYRKVILQQHLRETRRAQAA